MQAEGLAEEKFGSLLRGFGIKAWRPRGGQGARDLVAISVGSFSDAFSRYLQLKWPPDPEKPTGPTLNARKTTPGYPKKGGPRGPRGPQLTAPSEGKEVPVQVVQAVQALQGYPPLFFRPNRRLGRVDLEGKGSCVVISTPTQLQAYAAALSCENGLFGHRDQSAARSEDRAQVSSIRSLPQRLIGK